VLRLLCYRFLRYFFDLCIVFLVNLYKICVQFYRLLGSVVLLFFKLLINLSCFLSPHLIFNLLLLFHFLFLLTQCLRYIESFSLIINLTNNLNTMWRVFPLNNWWSWCMESWCVPFRAFLISINRNSTNDFHWHVLVCSSFRIELYMFGAFDTLLLRLFALDWLSISRWIL